MRRVAQLLMLLLGVSALCAAAPPRPAMPSMEDVLQLRDIAGGLSISPDGGAIALIVRDRRLRENDYRHTLMVIDARSGQARAIAEAGDAIVSNQDSMLNGAFRDRVVLWSPDGRWLAFLRAGPDGVELWRVRAQGGRAQRIASGPGDVRRFAWRGADLVFETATPRALLRAREQDARTNGFRVDDRFDPMYALSPLPDLNQGSVWTWAGGRIRPARADEAERLDLPASATADSARGAALANRDGAETWFDTYAEADPARRPQLGVFRQQSGGARERCEADFCRGAIRQVWWGDEDDIFFLRTEGFARADMGVYAWRGDGVHLARRIEGVMRDCAFAASAIVCIEETSLQPPRVVRIDPESGRATVLYDPNPDWFGYRLPAIARIDVRDRYGNPSFAYLLYPADYEPGRAYPAVVVQYRARGFLRAGVGGEYPVYEFARRGYFVINFERPNMDHVRGADSDEAWLRATELGHVEQLGKQSALEAVLARLAERGDIDMERIAITGLSDGAETLYWALTHSDLFAAAVAGTPPTDPSVWALTSETNRARLARIGLGADAPGADPAWRAWWAEMSAARHVERITAPVLLQLSEDEALTAFPFYARMRAHSHPIEFYIYPDAHHVRTLPSQLLAGQRRTVEWIDFWLKDALSTNSIDPSRRQ